jgi:hypothetical protein
LISRTYSAFHQIAQQELVTNGIVFGSVEDGYNDEPASIALAPNGKIVVAGETERGSFSDFAIARYHPWGALDADCEDDPTLLVVTTAPAPPEEDFSRGDVDGDGNLTMNDAIHFLKWNFFGNEDLACLDAADSNDDGDLTLDDAVFSLSFSFLGTAAPPAPFSSCGADPTPGLLGCQNYDACMDPNLLTFEFEGPPSIGS